MAGNITNVLKRILNSKKWIFSNYEIVFEDVLMHEGYIQFNVNIILQSKFQSYILELFEYRVDSIIKEISNYFDNSPTPFGGFVRKILVNGQEPLKIFINGRDQQFILEKINNTFTHFIDNECEFETKLFFDKNERNKLNR